MDAPWSPLTIDELRARLDTADAPWWIAGGVAIDLFLGWETRPHDDLDVEMFRSDRRAVRDAFRGWDLHVVSEGRHLPWQGEEIDPDVFAIWCRPTSTHPWAVEIILADGDHETWRFRRDPAITMPVDRLLRTASSGIRYGAPEVQLLSKAKRHRAKDDADLARCLHVLSDDAVAWLSAALERTEPEHAWIPVLAAAAERRTRMRDGGR